MSTKDLHPGLGSGALREALDLHEYRNGLCTCGQFVMPHYSYGDLVKFLETHPGRDIRWRFWLDHFAAALSLSSPIDAALKEKELTVAGHIRQAAADGCQCEPCCAARSVAPTSQASSEIRDILQALIEKSEKSMRCWMCSAWDMPGDERNEPHDKDCIYVRAKAALAPSRQGAGGK